MDRSSLFSELMSSIMLKLPANVTTTLSKNNDSHALTQTDLIELFFLALTMDHEDLITAILDQQPELLLAKNVAKKTALHIIAAHQGSNNVAIVNILLRMGCNYLFTTDLAGNTPLILAVEANNTKLVEYFLALPDFVNTIADNGEYPLSWAVKNQHFNLTQQLIIAGAKLDIKDRTSRTILHNSILGSGKKHNLNTLLFELLFTSLQTSMPASAFTVFLNLRDEFGLTNLHLAVLQDSVDISYKLLTYGADPHLINSAEYTPLSLAIQSGNVTLITLLAKHTRLTDIASIKGKTNYISLMLSANQSEVFISLVKDGYLDINNIVLEHEMGARSVALPISVWAIINHRIDVFSLVLSCNPNLDLNLNSKDISLRTFLLNFMRQESHENIIENIITSKKLLMMLDSHIENIALKDNLTILNAIKPILESINNLSTALRTQSTDAVKQTLIEHEGSISITSTPKAQELFIYINNIKREQLVLKGNLRQIVFELNNIQEEISKLPDTFAPLKELLPIDLAIKEHDTLFSTALINLNEIRIVFYAHMREIKNQIQLLTTMIHSDLDNTTLAYNQLTQLLRKDNGILPNQPPLTHNNDSPKVVKLKFSLMENINIAVTAKKEKMAYSARKKKSIEHDHAPQTIVTLQLPTKKIECFEHQALNYLFKGDLASALALINSLKEAIDSPIKNLLVESTDMHFLLCFCCDQGYVEMVDLLLFIYTKKYELNSLQYRAINFALKHGDLAILQVMEKHGLSFNYHPFLTDSNNHLALAIEHYQDEILRFILEYIKKHDSDKNYLSTIPVLHLAVAKQQEQAVITLLEYGADPRLHSGIDKILPAVYARYLGAYHIEQILLQAEIVKNNEHSSVHSISPGSAASDPSVLSITTNTITAQETLSHSLSDEDMLAIFNNISSIEHLQKALIACRQDVLLLRDKKNNTILHAAVLGKHDSSVTWLCEHYPRLKYVTNVKGELPLHLAANFLNSINMLALLTNETEDPSFITRQTRAYNQIGQLPLHIAIIKAVNESDIFSVCTLLKYDITTAQYKIHTRGTPGFTALLLAIQSQSMASTGILTKLLSSKLYSIQEIDQAIYFNQAISPVTTRIQVSINSLLLSAKSSWAKEDCLEHRSAYTPEFTRHLRQEKEDLPVNRTLSFDADPCVSDTRRSILPVT